MENDTKTPDSSRLEDARRSLAEYFRDKAAYRRSLAEQDPSGVGKNGRYAESLERMAAYVEALPADDPTLKEIAACDAFWPEWSGIFTVPYGHEGTGSFSADMAVHCGPRGGVINPAECAAWFASWAETAIKGAKEAAG
jgi:hypothetical protein